MGYSPGTAIVSVYKLPDSYSTLTEYTIGVSVKFYYGAVTLVGGE